MPHDLPKWQTVYYYFRQWKRNGIWFQLNEVLRTRLRQANGRKRHILVDTLGLLLAVIVHAANIQDRDGAKLLFRKIRGHFPRLEIWADGAYAGTLVDWVKQSCH